VSNAVSKVLYDSETELFNPKEMASEFAIGTAVGAVLGGAQTATMNTAKSVTDSVRTAKENQRSKKFYGSDPENIRALVLEGLESAEGSTSRVLAEQYQKKLDSGKSLTGAEISKLVEANEEAFRTESITTIQAAAEEKLTELKRHCPQIREVCCKGLAASIEFYDREVYETVQKQAKESGLIIGAQRNEN
jgi:hypothetical protein